MKQGRERIEEGVRKRAEGRGRGESREGEGEKQGGRKEGVS